MFIDSLHQWSLIINKCKLYPIISMTWNEFKPAVQEIPTKWKITSASRFFLIWSSASMENGSPTPYSGRRNRIMLQSNNCLSGYAHLTLSQYSEFTSVCTFLCNSASCQKNGPCQEGHSSCHFSVLLNTSKYSYNNFLTRNRSSQMKDLFLKLIFLPQAKHNQS